MMRGAVMLVMDGIKEFEFNEHGLQKLKELPKGQIWPVVYLIHDEKKPLYRRNYERSSSNESTFEK